MSQLASRAGPASTRYRRSPGPYLPPHADLSTVLPLVVRAVRLDSSAASLVFESARLARGIPDSTLFYPTSFELPTFGSWMLIATVGRNWGCFLYEPP